MTESDGEVPGETALTWIREEKVGKRKKHRTKKKKNSFRSETERQKTRTGESASVKKRM